MRISDWSSDVCSSDLIAVGARAAVDNDIRDHRPAGIFHFDADTRSAIAQVDRIRCATAVDVDLIEGAAAEDRKSVVSGQSVSVRVDLGGRRIIKKNNKHTAHFGDHTRYHIKQN